jgi:hypothetical protein
MNWLFVWLMGFFKKLVAFVAAVAFYAEELVL